MSDSTKEALEQAIATHFADEQDGAIVTGYVLQVQGQGFSADDEDMTRMSREIAEGQSLPTTIGLIEYARIRLANYTASD